MAKLTARGPSTGSHLSGQLSTGRGPVEPGANLKQPLPRSAVQNVFFASPAGSSFGEPNRPAKQRFQPGACSVQGLMEALGKLRSPGTSGRSDLSAWRAGPAPVQLEATDTNPSTEATRALAGRFWSFDNNLIQCFHWQLWSATQGHKSLLCGANSMQRRRIQSGRQNVIVFQKSCKARSDEALEGRTIFLSSTGRRRDGSQTVRVEPLFSP